MSVIPFPARPSTLDRFGQARREMLSAFAALVDSGKHRPEDLQDEIAGTASAMTQILTLSEIDHA